MKKKLLIIGGVAGGASCATRARRLDEEMTIIIFEKGPFVSFANCGLPYHIGKVIPDKENLIVATPEMFNEWFNIDIRTYSKVESINLKESKIRVKNIKDNNTYYEQYDHLLLSTGAKPNYPPINGINLPGIFTLRDIPDTMSIIKWINDKKVKNATILGGGFIGLEVTENLVKLGIKTSIVEKTSHIMPNIDDEMSLLVEKHIKKMGINLYLNCDINKFEVKKSNSGIITHFSSGKKLDSDIVIIATGTAPASNLAIKAGIKTSYFGGIKVNKNMQTNIPNIWAVGDVIENKNFISNNPCYTPLAGPANRQGRIAAKSITKSNNNSECNNFRGVQESFVCGILGLTVASTGLNENKIRKLSIKDDNYNYKKIHIHGYNHAEYYPNAKKIILKLIFSKKDGHIFGAQAIGSDGVEKRIDVIAMAIQKKATVFDLSEAELCYAPQYGSAKDIINISGMAACNIINKYFDVAHWEEIKHENENKIIIDVREDFIYKRGHIDNAINIPLTSIRKKIKTLPKNKEILVYCAEGKRSYYACRILNQKGYKTKSLSGGYNMYFE